MSDNLTDLTPEQLLELAKGVSDTEEAQMLKAKEQWYRAPETPQESRLKRRKIRKTLLGIAKNHANGNEEEENLQLKALKEIISEQLDPNRNMRWPTFTWTWDVGVQNPLQVILREEWFKSGGTIDPDIGVFLPAAFTQQIFNDKQGSPL